MNEHPPLARTTDERAERVLAILPPWGPAAVLAGLAFPLAVWASSLAISLGGGTDPGELSDSEVAAGILATIIVLDGALVAIPAFVAFWRHKRGWRSMGFRAFDLRLWWWPLAAAASGYIGVIAYGAIITAVSGETPDQDLEELFDSRALLPLAGLSTVIVAPFAEELFFRGFLFTGLLRPLGLAGAMVASGLVFGTFHIQDSETAILMPPFAAIGALFAWLYYRTGSLWPSIATHLLFNLVSFAILASVAGE